VCARVSVFDCVSRVYMHVCESVCVYVGVYMVVCECEPSSL